MTPDLQYNSTVTYSYFVTLTNSTYVFEQNSFLIEIFQYKKYKGKIKLPLISN